VLVVHHGGLDAQRNLSDVTDGWQQPDRYTMFVHEIQLLTLSSFNTIFDAVIGLV